MTATVIPLGYAPDRIVQARGEDTIYPGWHSPDFGIKYPAAVVALEWDAVRLPWVGGFLVVPGEPATFEAEEFNAEKGALSFELSGKKYSLVLR